MEKRTCVNAFFSFSSFRFHHAHQLAVEIIGWFVYSTICLIITLYLNSHEKSCFIAFVLQ